MKYLYYSIEMIAHGYLWYITHQVVQPVVQTGKHSDWLIHVTQSDAHCWVRIVAKYRQVAAQQHADIFKRPCHILCKLLFGLQINQKI